AQIFQFDVADVEQEVSQLPDPAGNLCSEIFERGIPEQVGVVLAHHAATGSGGHYNRPVLREQAELGGGDGAGLIVIARRVGRLSATGLIVREDNLDSFPLQQPDAGHAGVRVEQVYQAGTVEVHF